MFFSVFWRSSDKQKIAEAFNEYFLSIYSKGYQDSEMTFDLKTTSQMNSNPTDIIKLDNIEKRLSKLKSNKSSGCDRVHPHVLKSCAKALAIPLYLIFINSLTNGVIPEEWTKANITPVHKKGNKSELSNYRPISLTSIVCKILEGIIRDQIMQHMKANKLLSTKQHGFVNNRACNTNLLSCQDMTSKAAQMNNPVDILYTDFSKAFDKKDHKKLLLKIKSYGIDSYAHRWIKAFLDRRKQKVIMGKAEMRMGICAKWCCSRKRTRCNSLCYIH